MCVLVVARNGVISCPKSRIFDRFHFDVRNIKLYRSLTTWRETQPGSNLGGPFPACRGASLTSCLKSWWYWNIGWITMNVNHAVIIADPVLSDAQSAVSISIDLYRSCCDRTLLTWLDSGTLTIFVGVAKMWYSYTTLSQCFSVRPIIRQIDRSK